MGSAVALQQRYFEPLVIPDSVQGSLDWMRQHFEGVQGSIRAKTSAWLRGVITRGSTKEKEKLISVQKLLQEAQAEMAEPVALKDDSRKFDEPNLKNNRDVMKEYGFEVADDSDPETYLQVVADTMLRAINTNREILGDPKYTPEKSALLVAELARVICLFKDKYRKGSGEKYYWHLIGTAMILIQEMGFTSLKQIIAMLHHDSIEDIKEITKENLFDHPIYHGSIPALQAQASTRANIMTTIVDALSKLTHKEASTGSKRDFKTKSIKHLLTEASKEDMRIVICKIADRLFNMRDMERMPAASQENNARETLAIYAPLADALGFKDIANELLCLSLRYLGKAEIIKAYEEEQRRRYSKKMLPVKADLEAKEVKVEIKPIPFGMFFGRWLARNRKRNMDETLKQLDNIGQLEINDEFPLHTLVITVPDIDQVGIVWREISSIIGSHQHSFYETPHGNKEFRVFSNKYEQQHFIFTTPKNALLKKRGYTTPGKDPSRESYKVAERFLKSEDPESEQLLSLSVRIITPRGDSYEFPGDARIPAYANKIHSTIPARAIKACVQINPWSPEEREIPLTALLADYHGQVIRIYTRNDDTIPAKSLAVLHFVEPYGKDINELRRSMQTDFTGGRVKKGKDGKIQRLPSEIIQARGREYWDDICSIFDVEKGSRQDDLLEQLKKGEETDAQLLERIGCTQADPLQVFLDDKVKKETKKWNVEITLNADDEQRGILREEIIDTYKKGKTITLKEITRNEETNFSLSVDFSEEVNEEEELLSSGNKNEKTRGERYQHDRLLELYKLALALYMRGARVRLIPEEETPLPVRQSLQTLVEQCVWETDKLLEGVATAEGVEQHLEQSD